MTPRALLAAAPLAIALLVGGCSSSAMTGAAPAMSSDAMSKAPSAMASDAMSGSPTAMATDAMSSGAMSAHGSYVSYADYSSAMSKYSGTKVVYFFYASWCPECQASDKALTAAPDAIPSGVTLVKVDYDNSTQLKQKYGVTIHDTFVQVDPSGMKVMAWVGQTSDVVLAALKA